MCVKIHKVNYIPADTWIGQGYKRGQYPEGKYYGGNGTFREFAPADVEVVAYSDAGYRLIFRIGYDIRRILGRSRLTYRLYERVRDASPVYVEVVRSGDRWEISEDSLCDWIGNC